MRLLVACVTLRTSSLRGCLLKEAQGVHHATDTEYRSGIGLALAGRFTHNDTTVIVAGRNTAKLAEVRTALPAVITEQADMMDISALKRLAQAYPMVNVLINNAAVQRN